MPGMGGNAHERNAEEPFRNDFRNLQRVKLLPSLLRQNTLHCPAQRSRLVATQDGGSYFTGQVEKFQFTPSMFRASVERSRLLTTLHLRKKVSLSIDRFAGKRVSSLIKMVPALLVSDI